MGSSLNAGPGHAMPLDDFQNAILPKNKKDCQAIEPGIPFLERPRDSRAVQSDQSKLDVAVSHPPSLHEVMLTRNELPGGPELVPPRISADVLSHGSGRIRSKAQTRL